MKDTPVRQPSIVPVIASGIGFLIQTYAFFRYTTQRPGDWVGITIYALACGAFAVATAGFAISWRKGQKDS
jgi:hypothetical protein